MCVDQLVASPLATTAHYMRGLAALSLALASCTAGIAWTVALFRAVGFSVLGLLLVEVCGCVVWWGAGCRVRCGGVGCRVYVYGPTDR